MQQLCSSSRFPLYSTESYAFQGTVSMHARPMLIRKTCAHGTCVIRSKPHSNYPCFSSLTFSGTLLSLPMLLCGCGGIGIRARLRGVSCKGFGFKSRRPHTKTSLNELFRLVFFMLTNCRRMQNTLFCTLFPRNHNTASIRMDRPHRAFQSLPYSAEAYREACLPVFFCR